MVGIFYMRNTLKISPNHHIKKNNRVQPRVEHEVIEGIFFFYINYQLFCTNVALK